MRNIARREDGRYEGQGGGNRLTSPRTHLRKGLRLRKLLQVPKNKRKRVKSPLAVQNDDVYTRERRDDEIMDKFDTAMKKMHQISKASAGSGSRMSNGEKITSQNNAPSPQTASNKASSPSGVHDIPVPSSSTHNHGSHHSNKMVASWLKDSEASLLGLQHGSEHGSDSVSPEKPLAGTSRTTSRTASWVRSKLSCLCGGDVDNEANIAKSYLGSDIIEVVQHRKEEILKNTLITRGHGENIKRQIQFLQSQLEGIHKTCYLGQDFVRVVDDFDSLSLNYQKLQHRLEELETEREILKRKVLASRSASKAVRSYGSRSKIPLQVRVQDMEALTRLAYAGLLVEK